MTREGLDQLAAEAKRKLLFGPYTELKYVPPNRARGTSQRGDNPHDRTSEDTMADRQPNSPTHRAYSVIKREGQDDYWLNLGLVFPHKDGSGFNIVLQAFPLDGKIVCREIGPDDAAETAPQSRGHQDGFRGQRGRGR